MASNIEFVQYVCEQIGKAGFISYRMMFGDYCIYCDKKPVALVCDNQFFVKVTPEGGKSISLYAKSRAVSGRKTVFTGGGRRRRQNRRAPGQTDGETNPAPQKAGQINLATGIKKNAIITVLFLQEIPECTL